MIKAQKKLTENTEHLYFPFIFKNRKYIVAFIWSKQKGDWWYDTHQENRKFFWVNRKMNGVMTRYSLYIDRLAMSLMIEIKR